MPGTDDEWGGGRQCAHLLAPCLGDFRESVREDFRKSAQIPGSFLHREARPRSGVERFARRGDCTVHVLSRSFGDSHDDAPVVGRHHFYSATASGGDPFSVDEQLVDVRDANVDGRQR